MDRMEFYEINAIMEYAYYRHKDDWEIGRLISFCIAQVNSKKPLQITDIIKFGWENSKEEKAEQTISKERFERLQAMAANYINNNTNTI